jgi:Tfp pilus assembly PilM family ATPase
MFNRKPKSKPGELPVLTPPAFRKRTSATVLDVEAGRLRVVQASGQPGSARVAKVSEGPFQAAIDKKDDAKAFGAALKAALEAQKAKAKEIIFALPRAHVVLRPVQTPMVADGRELAALVNFQIAKELPFRIEDAVVDFKVLRSVEAAPAPGESEAGKAPERKLEVLVGAVKKDVVEFYRTAAKEAGLKLEGLGLRPLGHARMVRQAIAGAGESAILVVGVRRDETTVDVVDCGKLVFSRVAGVSFPEGEDGRAAFVQALQIEVVRSMHGYGGVPGHQPVSQLLIFGATGVEAAVAAALGGKLGLPAEAPVLPAKEGEAGAAAAACGLALSALEAGGLPLDFENPKKPAPPSNPRRTQMLVAAAAVLVLLFTLIGVRAQLIKKRVAVRQQVQIEVADADKKLPIYRRLKSQSKVVNGWLAEEQPWLEHIAYLSSVLPGADQIYLSAFTTTPQHVIRFSVQARSGELLAELDKKLRAAGYEVKPLSITPANDKHGYNFRTTVELAIPRKMKPDLSKLKPPARPADDSPPSAAAASAGRGGARS